MSLRISRKLPMTFLVITILAVFFSLFVHSAYSSELKIGYINSQRILEESKAGKEIAKNIEKFEKEKTDHIAQKKQEIEELEAELRKKEFAITPERKKEIEDGIRHKNLELKFFQESKDKEIKELYYKGLKKIENQVMDIVLKIGQEEGYDLILGRDESGILYANPKQDITDKVIQAYDQQMQK